MKHEKIHLQHKTLTEQIKSVQEKLNKEEEKHFALQPLVFKESGKVRSDFETLRGGLRELISSLIPNEQGDQLILELNNTQFDQAIAEIHAGDSSLLNRLIKHLSSVAENELSYFRTEEGKIARSREIATRLIVELQNDKDEKSMQHSLKLKEIRRKLQDSILPIRELQIAADTVKCNYDAVNNAMAEKNEENTKLQDEHAELHMRFLDFKRALEKLFADYQKANNENMAKLNERFEQIKASKELYKNLGEKMLENSINILKERSINTSKFEKVLKDSKDKS